MNEKSPNSARDFPGILPGYHVRVATFADRAQTAATVEPPALPDTIRHALTPGGGATNLAAGLQLIAEQIGDGCGRGERLRTDVGLDCLRREAEHRRRRRFYRRTSSPGGGWGFSPGDGFEEAAVDAAVSRRRRLVGQ